MKNSLKSLVLALASFTPTAALSQSFEEVRDSFPECANLWNEILNLDTQIIELKDEHSKSLLAGQQARKELERIIELTGDSDSHGIRFRRVRLAHTLAIYNSERVAIQLKRKELERDFKQTDLESRINGSPTPSTQLDFIEDDLAQRIRLAEATLKADQQKLAFYQLKLASYETVFENNGISQVELENHEYELTLAELSYSKSRSILDRLESSHL